MIGTFYKIQAKDEDVAVKEVRKTMLSRGEVPPAGSPSRARPRQVSAKGVAPGLSSTPATPSSSTQPLPAMPMVSRTIVGEGLHPSLTRLPQEEVEMSIPPSMLALTLFSNIDLYTFPCSETSKPDINMPQPSAEALEEGRKTRGQEQKKKEKKDREATASTKGSGKGHGKCLLFLHLFFLANCLSL